MAYQHTYFGGLEINFTRQKGLTLLELMIVITIVSILASIIVAVRGGI